MNGDAGIACEACGDTSKEVLHRDVFGYGTDFVRCGTCGLKFYAQPAAVSPADFYQSKDYDAYVEGEARHGSPCNDDASTADAFRSAVDALYAEYVAELSVLAGRLSRVFEVGCGTGRFLAVARSKGIDAHGCDLNRVNVELASVSGARVTRGFFQDVPVPDALDAMVMLDMIEHTMTPRADLERAAAHTRVGGVLVVKTFYDEFHDSLPGLDLSADSHGRESLERTGYFSPAAHPHHFDEPVLRKLIERVGYQIARWERDPAWGQVTVFAVRR